MNEQPTLPDLFSEPDHSVDATEKVAVAVGTPVGRYTVLAVSNGYAIVGRRSRPSRKGKGYPAWRVKVPLATIEGVYAEMHK